MGVTPPSNSALLLPYALPYAVYVGSAAAAHPWLSREAACALQVLATAAALLWARRRTGPLRGPRPLQPSLALGALVGIAGALLWIAGHDQLVAPGGEPWSAAYAGLRALAVVALVPVFEEQLLRGYALRIATQWDAARRSGESRAWDRVFHERSIFALEPGAATAAGIAISSALFALGHAVAQWPVALAYGVAMAWLYRARADLVSCVAAHATSNALLLAYASATGRWSL